MSTRIRCLLTTVGLTFELSLRPWFTTSNVAWKWLQPKTTSAGLLWETVDDFLSMDMESLTHIMAVIVSGGLKCHRGDHSTSTGSMEVVGYMWKWSMCDGRHGSFHGSHGSSGSTSMRFANKPHGSTAMVGAEASTASISEASATFHGSFPMLPWTSGNPCLQARGSCHK